MQAFQNFGALTENVRFVRKNEAGAWNEYLTTRAELIPETGSEVIKAEGTHPEVKVKFRIRYASLLARIDTRELRLLHLDSAKSETLSTYNVTYIEDDRNRHVTMYVVCTLEDR